MSLRLRSGDERQLVLGVSHAPYDSLRDLIEGLSSLLAGVGQSVVRVRWNCEPEEYDFLFLGADGSDSVAFEVIRYPDHRRREDASSVVFTHTGSRREICEAFWKETCGLQTRCDEDAFSRNWRNPFPLEEMRRLTDLVRSRGAETEPGSTETR